ncbi:hypothetical protein [Streptococcus himalayensis]|nr:hypothetical protein [Streptococcus himalayensis]
MKKYITFSIFLLGVLACFLAIQPLNLSSDVQVNHPKTSYSHVQNIPNQTVREFTIFCEETGASVQEILNLEYFPRDGQRFVTLGEHEPNKVPVLAFSSLGDEGIVARIGEEIYDTSDKTNSCTYDELKEQLLAWDKKR